MSLSRQLWRIVEDYQVLGSLAARLIYPERKESPVSSAGGGREGTERMHLST